jgi:hypothetical protein
MVKIRRFNENLVDKNLVKETTDRIIKFLNENDVRSWDRFVEWDFARNTVTKIIDTSIRTDQELKEVKFYIKLHLANLGQLKSMLKKYEELEEYEKCDLIHKKIMGLEVVSYF